MKILIIEAYTDANAGSAALIENAIALVRQYCKNASLKILAQNRIHVQNFSGIETYNEIFQLPFKKSRILQLIWLVRTVAWMLVNYLVLFLRLGIPFSLYTYNKATLNAIRQIQNCDVCISIGAERINDNFVFGLPFSLYGLWLVKKLGKKLVLFPQTIGPFYRKLSKSTSQKILSKCDYVFLRDKRSVDIMKSLGVPKRNYSFMPDIAILQESVDDSVRKSIFAQEHIPLEDGRLIGISAIRWSYANDLEKQSSYEIYKKSVAKAVDYMIEKYGCRVVFVPTNVGIHGCREDDIEVAHEIIENVEHRKRVHIIDHLYRPSELKGLIGDMDLFLATRMHACIFATGICTPTCSINYQFKLYEYMKYLGLENNTIDIREITFEKLRGLVDYTYKNRDQIREQLEHKITIASQLIHEQMQKLFTQVLK